MSNELKPMKAWLVREKDGDCSIVVFAETRGKARSIAMHTDCCEDAAFCDIEVSRLSHMDKYYKEGKKEMDWENPKDRLALVKECGFHCEYFDALWCIDCSAKEYCDTYIDYKREYEEGKR